MIPNPILWSAFILSWEILISTKLREELATKTGLNPSLNQHIPLLQRDRSHLLEQSETVRKKTQLKVKETLLWRGRPSVQSYSTVSRLCMAWNE